MAVWIIPTCGPLLWEMTTRFPASTRSATALAAFFVAIFCSGKVVPNALWPSATTVIFSLMGITSILSCSLNMISAGQKSYHIRRKEFLNLCQ